MLFGQFKVQSSKFKVESLNLSLEAAKSTAAAISLATRHQNEFAHSEEPR
jgi:hypothetical protein